MIDIMNLFQLMYYNITVIVVSGQNVLESIKPEEFVGHDVQLLRKKFFPVAKYFQFNNFRDIADPSALTRCLICGLNPVSLVTNYYTSYICLTVTQYTCQPKL